MLVSGFILRVSLLFPVYYEISDYITLHYITLHYSVHSKYLTYLYFVPILQYLFLQQLFYFPNLFVLILPVNFSCQGGNQSTRRKPATFVRALTYSFHMSVMSEVLSEDRAQENGLQRWKALVCSDECSTEVLFIANVASKSWLSICAFIAIQHNMWKLLNAVVLSRRVEDWHQLVRDSKLGKSQRKQLQAAVQHRFQVLLHCIAFLCTGLLQEET